MNVVIINKDQPLMNFSAAGLGHNVVVSFDGVMPRPVSGITFTQLQPHPPGFYAGANRNQGLHTSYVTYGKTGYVLFLDGDRTPENFSIEIVLSTLNRYGADALLLTCQADNRAIALSKKPDGLVDTGCLVSEFYSCGFVMTDKAISAVMACNNGMLFHPAFNGHWGEEDKYLGIQLHALGFRTCFTNKIKLGGGPLGNPSAHPDYGHSLQTRMNLMRANGYCFRSPDMYAHLEKDPSGRIVKTYTGMPR